MPKAPTKTPTENEMIGTAGDRQGGDRHNEAHRNRHNATSKNYLAVSGGTRQPPLAKPSRPMVQEYAVLRATAASYEPSCRAASGASTCRAKPSQPAYGPGLRHAASQELQAKSCELRAKLPSCARGRLRSAARWRTLCWQNKSSSRTIGSFVTMRRRPSRRWSMT